MARSTRLTTVVVAVAVAGAAALAFGAGCHRKVAPPDPCMAAAALVEVRDREGVLELALRPLHGAAIVCDAHGRPLGTFVRVASPPSLVIKNAAGDAEATLTLARGPNDGATLNAGATSLRLYEDGSLLRVLDASGVPLGQVSRDGARALVFDAAGRALAEATRADPDGDRRVIRGVDGTVKKLVAGTHDDRAAAAFGLEALPLVERLLLSRWLDSNDSR